jgi:hypothetical protein
MAKTKNIHFRCTEKEYEDLKKYAGNKGVSSCATKIIRLFIQLNMNIEELERSLDKKQAIYNEEGELLHRGLPGQLQPEDIKYMRIVRQREDGGIELYSKTEQTKFVLFPGDKRYRTIKHDA